MTTHYWVEARNNNTRNCHNKLWSPCCGICFAYGWVTVNGRQSSVFGDDARRVACQTLGDLFQGERHLYVYPEDRVESGYNPKDKFKIDKATVKKIRF